MQIQCGPDPASEPLLAVPHVELEAFLGWQCAGQTTNHWVYPIVSPDHVESATEQYLAGTVLGRQADSGFLVFACLHVSILLFSKRESTPDSVNTVRNDSSGTHRRVQLASHCTDVSSLVLVVVCCLCFGSSLDFAPLQRGGPRHG